MSAVDELDLPVGTNKPYLRAYVWYCGDEVCDCKQPRIEECHPRGRGWTFKTLWEGTFLSGWDHDDPDLAAELAAECERRGIPVGVSPLP